MAFLISLGGLASTLPSHLARISALSGGVAKAGGGGGTSAIEQRLEAQVAERLSAQGVDGAAELVKQARGQSMHNPLIDVLLGQGAASRPAPRAEPAAAPSLPSFPSSLPWKPSRDTALYASTAATWGPVFLLGLAALLAIVDLKGAARALVGLTHWCTGTWLIVLSAAAPGLRYLWRVDVWGAIPSELCWAPAVAVLVSAFFLRLLDINEPVWNKTVHALAAPVLSGVVVPLLS